jgi:hypothetical protein
MISRKLTRAAAAFALVVVGACSDSTAPAVSANEAKEEMMANLHTVVLRQIAAMYETESGLSTSCSPAAQQWQQCLDRRGELQLTRELRHFNGTAPAAQFSVATDSIQMRLAMRGRVTGEKRQWVSHSDTLVVRIGKGSPGQRTWNGSGVRTDTLIASGSGNSQVRYIITGRDTVKGVSYYMPRARNGWPGGGQFIHNYSAQTSSANDGGKARAGQYSNRAVVVFNGTYNVPVAFSDQTCMMNLNDGTFTKCRVPR